MKNIILIIILFLMSPVMAMGQTVYSAELQNKAEQGDAKAQYELGRCYNNAKGVEKNLEKAFYWFKKAAEQGLAKAQNNLGYC